MKKMKKLFVLVLCFAFAVNLFAMPQDVQAKNKNTLKSKVTATYKKTQTGILVIYKNKNKKNVHIKGTVCFRDANKKNTSKETQENLCLGAKSTATFFFAAPRDENGDCVNYSSYSGKYSVSKSGYKSSASKIKMNSQLDVVEAKFVAVNASAKKLSHIHATFVFYNSSGSIGRCFTKELTCYKPADIEQFSIQYPDDMQDPSKVRVYIDWAY